MLYVDEVILKLLIATNSKLQFAKRMGVIAMGLFLSACMAGKPKITSKDSQGGDNANKLAKVSTKQNFASAAGTALSGTNKIKFTIGYNVMDSTSNYSNSGVTRIRASAAGVIHER